MLPCTCDLLYCAPSFHCSRCLSPHLRQPSVRASAHLACRLQEETGAAVVVDGTITTACHRPRERQRREDESLRFATVVSTVCNKCCGWDFFFNQSRHAFTSDRRNCSGFPPSVVCALLLLDDQDLSINFRRLVERLHCQPPKVSVVQFDRKSLPATRKTHI
jgi:hypothetical protein